MLENVTDYLDVAGRARELRCRVPTELALLPQNFSTAGSASELCYDEVASDIRAAWRSVGLTETGLGKRCRKTSVFDGAFGPRQVHLTFFFGAGLLARDPGQVTLALGAAACALTELANEKRQDWSIKAEAIVERSGGCGFARIPYEGDACDLLALGKTVREVWAGGRQGSQD